MNVKKTQMTGKMFSTHILRIVEISWNLNLKYIDYENICNNACPGIYENDSFIIAELVLCWPGCPVPLTYLYFVLF